MNGAAPGRWARWIPALGWLPRYRRSDFRGDLSAALTVSVMLVPQGMAYALLAGLPPIVGLYAATVPLFVYALLGTSRQLAVGPVAMMSLLTATAVGKWASPGSPEYLAYALALAALVGGLQLGMGLLRLGFLVRFLAHPVVSGFTSAAALVIAFSQLKGLLGVNLPRTHHIHEIAVAAIREMGHINLPTLGIGLATIAILVLARRHRPAYPAALGVVILGTLLTWMFGLDAEGVRVVGHVPSGLPPLTVPRFRLSEVSELLQAALIIAFVGFMESIAVAKSLASRHRHDIDPNQELVALGAANLAAGFFGSYSVAGGFGRSAVNSQAGARTHLASMLTAVFLSIVLLFFTPLFTYLPIAVLSSIIVVAVWSLIDVREVLHLWKVKRSDAGLLIVTFLVTLWLGIEQGIGVGVLASLVLFIARTTRPHAAVLGRLPERPDVYRNVLRYPQAQTIDGLLILRVDATFYFANMDFLREHLARLEREQKVPLRAVIIDASSINDLDSSAASALLEIAREYEQRGIALSFASVKGPVRDVMARSGLSAELGPRAFAFTVDEAVLRHEKAQHEPAHRPAALAS